MVSVTNLQRMAARELGKVLSVKTQGNEEYGTFKGPISLK